MWNIFKDDNNWNEKAIVGFIAFIVMCIIMIADLVTGWFGKDLVINEFVYDLAQQDQKNLLVIKKINETLKR